MLNVKSLIKKAVWLVLFCWLLVSFAALAGMYKLWWQRERVLYLGKPVTEQRRVVFERAGFPPSLVEKTESLRKQWPSDSHYTARGDANALSYITYLLAPRIPDESGSYSVTVQGNDLAVTGGNIKQTSAEKRVAETNNPAGLLLSLAVLVGWAGLIRLLWRGSIPSWPESFALSCFFLTLLTVLTRFFIHSAEPAFAGAVAIGIIGWLATIFNYFRKGKQTESIEKGRFADKKKKERLALGLLGGIIFLAICWSFFMAVVVVPDDWDAWAIWGSKARVLAQGSGPLYDVTKFGHPDYPLLWPTVWAFSGWLTGGWEEYWSKGWGAIFLLFCVWEIIHIVKEQGRSLTAGLLAGALFVSVPNVPLIASWGYAEAPLWLMMTCGLACLLRWQSGNGRDGIVLIGLFAAAAAYTKNEGVLFSVLLGVLFLFAGQSHFSRFRAVCLYALTFLSCYLLWWYWSRISSDLGSHATSGLHFGTDALHRAIERISSAREAICTMWRDIRQWNIVGFGIVPALLYSLFRSGNRRFQLFCLFLPCGMLLGYFVIILFHQSEIYWQIGTAWNRLTVQVLPLLIILSVLLVLPCGVRSSSKI